MEQERQQRGGKVTVKEFVDSIRTEAEEGYNGFLEALEKKTVKVVRSGFLLEKRALTLAVYPTATSGSTYSENNGESSVNITFQMFCNRNATEEGVEEALEYYSAFIAWIGETTFGKYSDEVQSVICRMDEGEPVNGFIVLLSSRLGDLTDCGWG